MMEPTMNATLAFALSKAAPIIDIDGTLWIQGGLFIALMVVLNPLLFRPWLETRERRTRSIDGALAEAGRINLEGEDLIQERTIRLATAEDDGRERRSASRREVDAEQTAKLARVRDVSSRQLEQERKRIMEDAAVARAAMNNRVDELAAQISAKVLGRS
jgi:F-type H+-transporting ATPase subunit b